MATMNEVSIDSLKAAVQGIAPVIEKHRAEAEIERQLPGEVVTAMRDAGLLRLWTPQEYGGSEVDLRTFMELGESIARIDSAAGWIFATGGAICNHSPMTKLANLDRVVHQKLRVRDDVAQSVCRGISMCAASLGEIPRLVVEYPLAFTKNPETGEFVCVVLFGVDPTQNLFWRDDRWNSDVIPLNVARQPFAVTTAGAAGSFELNVMMPVLARNVLESVRLLSTSTRLLAERCVDGITADADRMREYAESSPSVVTPLNKHIGYEAAAKVAKRAIADGTTIREAVIAQGHVENGDLTEEQLDEALDVESMTHP